MNQLTKAASDVLAERARQIENEGWTEDHDDSHPHGEMARAAATYCLCADGPQKPGTASELYQSRRWDFNILGAIWPRNWNFNPKDRRSNLVRAAALLLAEIERLDRASGVKGTRPDNIACDANAAELRCQWPNCTCGVKEGHHQSPCTKAPHGLSPGKGEA